MWALGAALALAADDELEHRAALYDALLEQSLSGDGHTAQRAYLSLSHPLEVGEYTRAEALMWLGRARYDTGNVEGARTALIDAIRSGGCSTRCRDLLELIDVEQSAIRALPVRWTFDSPDHGFFHPWQVQDQGGIRLARAPNGDPALMWTTTPQPRKRDRLVVGLIDPIPSPVELELRVSSTSAPAQLQLIAIESSDRAYGLMAPWRIASGATEVLRIPLDALAPVQVGDPPLDSGALTRLYLVDVSAEGATNTLWLHDFAIR